MFFKGKLSEFRFTGINFAKLGELAKLWNQSTSDKIQNLKFKVELHNCPQGKQKEKIWPWKILMHCS